MPSFTSTTSSPATSSAETGSEGPSLTRTRRGVLDVRPRRRGQAEAGGQRETTRSAAGGEHIKEEAPGSVGGSGGAESVGAKV